MNGEWVIVVIIHVQHNSDTNHNDCWVIDTSKSIKDVWDKTAAEAGADLSTYKNYPVISAKPANSNNGEYDNLVLLSDTRVLVCEGEFDYKTTVDNIANPKKLKDTDNVLYTAYSQTDPKADHRSAQKMSDQRRYDYIFSISDVVGKDF